MVSSFNTWYEPSPARASLTLDVNVRGVTFANQILRTPALADRVQLLERTIRIARVCVRFFFFLLVSLLFSRFLRLTVPSTEILQAAELPRCLRATVRLEHDRCLAPEANLGGNLLRCLQGAECFFALQRVSKKVMQKFRLLEEVFDVGNNLKA